MSSVFSVRTRRARWRVPTLSFETLSFATESAYSLAAHSKESPSPTRPHIEVLQCHLSLDFLVFRRHTCRQCLNVDVRLRHGRVQNAPGSHDRRQHACVAAIFTFGDDAPGPYTNREARADQAVSNINEAGMPKRFDNQHTTTIINPPQLDVNSTHTVHPQGAVDFPCCLMLQVSKLCTLPRTGNNIELRTVTGFLADQRQDPEVFDLYLSKGTTCLQLHTHRAATQTATTSSTELAAQQPKHERPPH